MDNLKLTYFETYDCYRLSTSYEESTNIKNGYHQIHDLLDKQNRLPARYNEQVYLRQYGFFYRL
jgi:hypothetical protein